MTTELGTLEELPVAYREALAEASLVPLWPMLRGMVPPGQPHSVTRACLWPFERIKPLLLKAGELTPVERTERRVLSLCDPGRGGTSLMATPTIYIGMQLLLPGETAPSHRHTPSAARVIVEGEGAYTLVDGETCVMEPGDVILTPGGTWHEHGHTGTEPVIWMDALDLPLLVYAEGSFSEEGKRTGTPPAAMPSPYTHPGLVPNREKDERAAYPMLRFPWKQTEAALRSMATSRPEDAVVEVDYVNPETGDDCLPVLGFTAVMLTSGRPAEPPVRSSSAVFHVISGSGQSTVDDQTFTWRRGDTFSAPVFSTITHVASGNDPAFLMRVHDTPFQRKLRFYSERPRA